MITVELNGKQISIPNQWNELSEKEYVGTITLVDKFFTGDIEAVVDFRLELLSFLSGYKRSSKQYSQEAEDTINSNLVILSEQLRFPILPNYENPELLETLSEELQQEMKVKFPFEIVDPEHLPQIDKIASLIKVSPILNYNLKCNPIREIKIKGRKLFGPQFMVDSNGVVTTDIKVEEYLDAQEYYKLLLSSGDEKYLDNLIAILYRPDRNKYDTYQSQLRSESINSIEEEIKRGVFVFMQSLQEFFCLRSRYSVLFSGGSQETSSQEDVITLGVYNSLYQLSKTGYGSPEQVKQMPILDFMNLLLKQLIDAVHTLRGMKKNNLEIAKELEMDIEIVNRL